MDNNETNNGHSTPVARGLIADYEAFKKTMNAHIERICAKRKSWASEEATEFFVTLFDEYVAVLPTVYETDPNGERRAVGVVTPDVDDIRSMIARMVNMNACNNRYAEAGLIIRQEKGKRTVGHDLR